MRVVFIFIFSCIFLYGVDAVIKVEKDVEQRVHISVIDSSTPNSINKKLFELFIADFKISSHFLPSKKYYQDGFGDSFKEKIKNSEYLLKYRVKKSNHSISLEIKLFKAGNLKKILQKNYSINTPSKYPFLVHRATTDINNRLGFNSIDWINRYIVYSEYRGKKRSVIGVADYTFSYKKDIIRGGLNIFPIWGDKNQKSIYYTSFDRKKPTLYRLDFRSGKISEIISSEGMLICSDISKDGSKLLLTMAPESQPDIYEYNLNTKSLKRVTTFRGIDVGGKYANNQKDIVFVSNRLGYANIFKKSLTTNAVESIVFHGKNNDSCDAWAKRVVYSSKDGRNSFNLYLTTTDATTSRPLTSLGINQFPKFSVDGNTILYIKRKREGNFIGYLNLSTNNSLTFPISLNRIQAIDW